MQVKIFTCGSGVKQMEIEINKWLQSFKMDQEIILMTQSESEETLIITFLYR